jgi:hypothetical protein
MYKKTTGVRSRLVVLILIVFAICTGDLFAQDRPVTETSAAIRQNPESSEAQQPANAWDDRAPKRIFGIIPNYRTTPGAKDYTPLTSRQKFRIATQDSFDRGTFILSALFAGESQLTRSTPSFGNGPSGYAKYFAASYSDFVIGNYMTEAIYSTILHQDPRYFRRATGSALSRLGYSVGQIFWTHTDSGRKQFNFSEVLGNSTGVAISNAYYSDNRNAGDAAMRFGIQIGVDMAGNIFKEFSPELNQLFSRKHAVKQESLK